MKKRNMKALAMSLAKPVMKERHKKTLLKEFFLMCKMMFMVRSIVSYAWGNNLKVTDVIKSIDEDDSLAKRIRMVKTAFLNVFTGTDPKQTVLGTIKH